MTETDRNTTMKENTIPVDKLRSLLDGEGSAEDKIQAIYDDLLPPALPDPLFGARATHPEYGEGIVGSHHPGTDGNVRLMVPNEAFGDGTDYRWVSPSALTFHTPETPETPETPDHPEFLTTEADYRGAPAGTVVTIDDEGAWTWTKGKDGCWELEGVGGVLRNYEMCGEARRVLQWGWEA